MERIGREAGVTRQHVCHVLGGRYVSRRVVDITKRLIAEHDAASKEQEGTAA